MLSSFPLHHEDYVHDMAFDQAGKRIATCSSDQRIRIWEKKQKLILPIVGGASQSMETSAIGGGENYTVEWELVDELGKSKGHSSAVLKVQWADPEFGSVLASCSYDK